MTPTGELYRYTIANPRDALARELPIYTANDFKAVQDWTLERAFRRIPRIIDVTGFGGSVKRYEVHPDPDRLRQYGVTLQQLQDALSTSNANVGGDFVVQGHTVQVVRTLGLIGGGQDPMQAVLGMKDPEEAAAYLRAEENRRILEIRQIVLTATNNIPATMAAASGSALP